MNGDTLRTVTAALAASGPLGLIGFGLLPEAVLNPKGIRAARAGAWVALAAFGLSCLAAAALVPGGVTDVSLPIWGDFRLGLYFDRLSAVLLTLVSFLLAIIGRYSVNYLSGDAAQGRFVKWLCLTGGSALAILISGNLIQFALAWCATSLSLHHLLLFYGDRPGAALAARKKFILSRLGDACLIAAIFLVHRTFHNWDFSALFASAQRLREAGPASGGPAITLLCSLLVACAMLKSAQFPFHSWLPDTMEAPTPVSALMHAGIINAGGFLIIRLSPVMTLSPASLHALALSGAFTALFASLVMLTHASVKRSLAFSTVAQMGFMMLECGAGAFGPAVLHLVAHSLYKAHAFLASGGAVNPEKSAGMPREGSRANRWLQEAVFAAFFGGSIAVLMFGLHPFAARILDGGASAPVWHGAGDGISRVGAALALFFTVVLARLALPGLADTRLLRAVYVHARNGFYFNTIANRFVASVWPVRR